MGGGKQKKQDKRSKKPVATAGKAIKRIGGSIRFVREKQAEDVS
ncbi:MAG: hypothetical protein ACYC3S_14435 [Chloroflexota bacterium]